MFLESSSLQLSLSPPSHQVFLSMESKSFEEKKKSFWIGKSCLSLEKIHVFHWRKNQVFRYRKSKSFVQRRIKVFLSYHLNLKQVFQDKSFTTQVFLHKEKSSLSLICARIWTQNLRSNSLSLSLAKILAKAEVFQSLTEWEKFNFVCSNKSEKNHLRLTTEKSKSFFEEVFHLFFWQINCRLSLMSF